LDPQRGPQKGHCELASRFGQAHASHTAERAPSPSALIPVLSIKRFIGPLVPRYGRLTFSVRCRRHKGAEIRHRPVQADQPQQALDEPSCLPRRHTKQDLQRQTSLNGGVTELLLPTAFAARRRRPSHLGIKSDPQGSAPLQAVVVRRPIRGLVCRRGPTAHALQLSRWIHTVNPIRRFVQQSHSRIPSKVWNTS